MRAVYIPKYGKPDVLELRETPTPEPARAEVRISVRAAGLNFADVMARQGLYPDAPKPPMVMGYEVAGRIDAVGSGVTSRREGDRVCALTRFGGHADTVLVPERQCFTLPAAMSFAEGAALPVDYLTAHHMLHRVFRVRSGDHVLVHQAAGGVGTAAVQICQSVEGLTTYGTASGPKHPHVRKQGCDHVIDYRTEDYEAVINELNHGRGLDLVLDALGPSDWRKGYRLLRPSGMLIAFGWASLNKGGRRKLPHVLTELTKTPFFLPVQLMNDNKAVAGVNMGRLWNRPEMIREEMHQLMALYEGGFIPPHIDKVFPLEEAAQAHTYLEQGRNVGKVLLAPDSDPRTAGSSDGIFEVGASLA